MDKNNFVEVCLYEVKPDKVTEFEDLINRVVKHHREFPGVIVKKILSEWRNGLG